MEGERGVWGSGGGGGGVVFFFQAEDGIRDIGVTGVQTCALPISPAPRNSASPATPCGGDVPVDVASTTPADGATGIALGETLSVTFNQPVQEDRKSVV